MVLNWLRKRKVAYRNYIFYKRIIRPGDFCFDIGANVGEKSELFLRIGASVLAIEPQLDCFNTLSQRFDSNTSFIACKLALGASEKSELMNISNESQISTFSNDFIEAYSYQKEFNWDRKETVEMTTLDKLIVEYGVPSFVKIDVEGYEIEVLKGLTQKIPMMCFEFNFPLIEIALECIAYLKRFGEPVYNYTVFNKPKFESKRWLTSTEMITEIKSFSPDTKTGDIYVKTP